jgi:hypothetical protein
MEPAALDTVAGRKEHTLLKGNGLESDQGETEDEEVKRNCIMGLSVLRDSDFSDTDEDDDVDNDDAEDDETVKQDEKEQQSLVQFVPVGRMSEPQGAFLYRPTPIVAALPIDREESKDGNSRTNNESDER